jgi:hypothetical protein
VCGSQRFIFFRFQYLRNAFFFVLTFFFLLATFWTGFSLNLLALSQLRAMMGPDPHRWCSGAYFAELKKGKILYSLELKSFSPDFLFGFLITRSDLR